MSKKQPNKNQRDRARKLLRILNEHYERGMHTQNIIDVMTDIRHMCDVKNINFYVCHSKAYANYLWEKKNEDDPRKRRSKRIIE